MKGTVLNIGTILVGTAIGVMIGDRLPTRHREIMLDSLGLFVLLLGIQSAQEVFGPVLSQALGRWAVLVILGSLLAGALIGEWLNIDAGLTMMGAYLKRRFVP
jgi:uncharacterized membrane protein YqgA involved in biofilm formation